MASLEESESLEYKSLLSSLLPGSYTASPDPKHDVWAAAIKQVTVNGSFEEVIQEGLPLAAHVSRSMSDKFSTSYCNILDKAIRCLIQHVSFPMEEKEEEEERNKVEKAEENKNRLRLLLGLLLLYVRNPAPADEKYAVCLSHTIAPMGNFLFRQFLSGKITITHVGTDSISTTTSPPTKKQIEFFQEIVLKKVVVEAIGNKRLSPLFLVGMPHTRTVLLRSKAHDEVVQKFAVEVESAPAWHPQLSLPEGPCRLMLQLSNGDDQPQHLSSESQPTLERKQNLIRGNGDAGVSTHSITLDPQSIDNLKKAHDGVEIEPLSELKSAVGFLLHCPMKQIKEVLPLLEFSSTFKAHDTRLWVSTAASSANESSKCLNENDEKEWVVLPCSSLSPEEEARHTADIYCDFTAAKKILQERNLMPFKDEPRILYALRLSMEMANVIKYNNTANKTENYGLPPSHLWESKVSDCQFFARIFATNLRLNGIPCREEVVTLKQSFQWVETSWGISGPNSHAVCAFFDNLTGRWISMDPRMVHVAPGTMNRSGTGQWARRVLATTPALPAVLEDLSLLGEAGVAFRWASSEFTRTASVTPTTTSSSSSSPATKDGEAANSPAKKSAGGGRGVAAVKGEAEKDHQNHLDEEEIITCNERNSPAEVSGSTAILHGEEVIMNFIIRHLYPNLLDRKEANNSSEVENFWASFCSALDRSHVQTTNTNMNPPGPRKITELTLSEFLKWYTVEGGALRAFRNPKLIWDPTASVELQSLVMVENPSSNPAENQKDQKTEKRTMLASSASKSSYIVGAACARTNSYPWSSSEYAALGKLFTPVKTAEEVKVLKERVGNESQGCIRLKMLS